ncbi:MAG: hypothetical protein SFW35_13425 [Chitinophagales bacterium]|nr:hypothetical protein [Chitinophagales bacterium]
MQTLTIAEAVRNNRKGFYLYNRIILPFKGQVLKLIIHDDIHIDFAYDEDIEVSQDPQNTSIYLRGIRLDKFIDSYKTIKLVCAEWDADLTDASNHIKLICKIQDQHCVMISKPDENTLFIE